MIKIIRQPPVIAYIIVICVQVVSCLCPHAHTLFFFSELPLIFITPLSDIKVFEKDEAKFECEVSREPKTYRWLKGTQEITGDDKIELIKDGTKHSLVIKSAAFEDEAKYIFEAEDKHTSGKLIIEGKHSYQIGYL